MYEEYESLHTQWYDTSCGEAHPGGQTQTRPAAAAPHNYLPAAPPVTLRQARTPGAEGTGRSEQLPCVCSPWS